MIPRTDLDGNFQGCALPNQLDISTCSFSIKIEFFTLCVRTTNYIPFVNLL